MAFIYNNLVDSFLHIHTPDMEDIEQARLDAPLELVQAYARLLAMNPAQTALLESVYDEHRARQAQTPEEVEFSKQAYIEHCQWRVSVLEGVTVLPPELALQFDQCGYEFDDRFTQFATWTHVYKCAHCGITTTTGFKCNEQCAEFCNEVCHNAVCQVPDEEH